MTESVTAGARGWNYHVAVHSPEHGTVAACDRLMLIEAELPAYAVHEDSRCRRPGCRVRWPHPPLTTPPG